MLTIMSEAGRRTGLSPAVAPLSAETRIRRCASSLPAGTRGILDDERAFSERLATLSEMHLLVLALIARGQLNKQIAFACGIAHATVKSHVSEILRRLKARSRTEVAVKYAVYVERRGAHDDA